MHASIRKSVHDDSASVLPTYVLTLTSVVKCDQSVGKPHLDHTYKISDKLEAYFSLTLYSVYHTVLIPYLQFVDTVYLL